MGLRNQIKKICSDFPRYGYRGVTKELQRERWIFNYKRMLRMMRENNLLCRIKRQRIKTTNSEHSYLSIWPSPWIFTLERLLDIPYRNV